jgi:hypothetical protein
MQVAWKGLRNFDCYVFQFYYCEAVGNTENCCAVKGWPCLCGITTQQVVGRTFRAKLF